MKKSTAEGEHHPRGQSWTIGFPTASLDSFFQRNYAKFPHFGGSTEKLASCCIKVQVLKLFPFLPDSSELNVLTLDDFESAFVLYEKQSEAEGKATRDAPKWLYT